MTAIAPKDIDQFIRFAYTCNVVVWVQTQVNPARYTIAGLPMDMVLTGMTQVAFDKAKLAFPGMEEVTSITP